MAHRSTVGRTAAFGIAVVLAFGTACNREPEAPVGQIGATTAVATPDEPMTVRGCVRAGEAANTFVLTTAVAETGDPAATYVLAGASAQELEPHLNEHVEVHGVITEAERRLQTTTADRQEAEARGTAGTPTVATTTELEFRELQVREIRPVEGSCEP